jgi:ABC-type transport system involved in cytochrome bd biosynthesis fused ATPase/permease subunit
MDKVTASLEEGPERHVLSTAHAAFSYSTILAVAHRLKTLLGYEVVVVLDAGRRTRSGNGETGRVDEDGRWVGGSGS